LPLRVSVSRSSHAQRPPGGAYWYDVIHETYGKIGTHSVRFAREGPDLIVSTRVRVEVKELFITLYRFESDGREVWRDDWLLELDSTTDDNGAETTVKGWAEADKFVIEGPDGWSEAMGRVYTTNAWNRALVGSPVLLDPTNGKLLMVTRISHGYSDGGEVTLGSFPARSYVVTGEMQGQLWHGPDGTWLRMDFAREDYSLVSITLNSAPPRGLAAVEHLAVPRSSLAAAGF